MKILYNNYLYESISFKDTYLDIGTELYHGTVETINGNLDVGAYDNVLWFSTNTSVAQSYIKCNIYLNVNSKSLIKHSKRLEKIQKQLGIVFDPKYNSSWKMLSPPEFNEINNRYLSAQKELVDLKDKIKKSLDKDDVLKVKLEELEKEILNNNPDSLKMKYVDEKLSEFGYIPNNDEYSNNFYGNEYKLKVNENDELLRSDNNTSGKLYIGKLKKVFKFLNISKGVSNENNLQYHKLKTFRMAEDKGYDGIIIDDFAQHEDLGNVPHISYGIFKNSIKDIDFEYIEACRPETIEDSPTFEYQKYSKS